MEGLPLFMSLRRSRAKTLTWGGCGWCHGNVVTGVYNAVDQDGPGSQAPCSHSLAEVRVGPSVHS